jgi:MSHA biogenesis protein MshE
MIGEMRDHETAEIGLRAAMTGHLVLSTLHTNDAVSSPIRLVDMGVESYLAASALRAVIAQRLVRKVCDSCPEPYEPDPRERAWLIAAAGPTAAQIRYLEGRGCSHCNGTGYRGRIGIFEFLQLDEAMTDALRRNDPEGFAAATRQQPDFRPLVLCALDYAGRGVTSLHEVFRMVEGLEDSLEPTTLSEVTNPSLEPEGAGDTN